MMWLPNHNSPILLRFWDGLHPLVPVLNKTPVVVKSQHEKSLGQENFERTQDHVTSDNHSLAHSAIVNVHY